MKRLGYLLVFLQFGGIGIACYAALQVFPDGPPIFLGLLAAGVFLGLYTLVYNRIGNFNVSPELRNNARLVTTGPYRFIRHPMYLSVILALVGLSLYAGNLLAWSGCILATAAMLGKSYIEERYLLARFPAYAAYRSQTKRLIPFIF